MNMNLKTVAHDTLQSVESNIRNLREKIAASMTEDEKSTWNQAVEAAAEVVEETSKVPSTTWGQVKSAILKLKK